MKTPALKALLVSYITHLKTKNLRSTSISLYLSSIELFLDMNEVNYPKKVIRRLLPLKDKKQGGDKPYTTQEIQRMLKTSPKFRTKTVVLIFSSTGMRPNGLHDPIITLGDMIRLPDGTVAVLIYRDSDEEFWTFFTQETVKAIDEYVNYRKLNGEHIEDSSPLIENKGKPIGSRAIRHILNRVLKNAGIKRIKTGNRYDKALIYGFRKRFNTVLKISDNNVNPNIAEKLIAHKRGLDGTYLTPTMEECHKEFSKAIHEIVIDDAARNELEIELKNKKINELTEKTNQIKDQQKQIDLMNKKIEEMDKRDGEYMKKSFPTTL